jgi:hypothetical protein
MQMSLLKNKVAKYLTKKRAAKEQQTRLGHHTGTHNVPYFPIVSLPVATGQFTQTGSRV